MLDHHLQALRSMPVNLSLNSSSSAEHQASKYGSPCPTRPSRGGDGKGGGGVPLVKTESEMSVGVACSGGAYQDVQREPVRMAYEQSHCDFPLAGFLKSERRSPPDSTNDGAAAEVGRLGGVVIGVFTLLQLQFSPFQQSFFFTGVSPKFLLRSWRFPTRCPRVS